MITAHRFPSTMRAFTRACSLAITSLLAALSACGAALPPGL